MIRPARRFASWWWRRTKAIRPTRDGWWCVFAAVGLGVAAVNTGNNLAYLLCSMLLALIIVSGMLSDLTIRGLQVTVTLPDAIHATQPALVTIRAGQPEAAARVLLGRARGAGSAVAGAGDGAACSPAGGLAGPSTTGSATSG